MVRKLIDYHVCFLIKCYRLLRICLVYLIMMDNSFVIVRECDCFAELELENALCNSSLDLNERRDD